MKRTQATAGLIAVLLVAACAANPQDTSARGATAPGHVG